MCADQSLILDTLSTVDCEYEKSIKFLHNQNNVNITLMSVSFTSVSNMT